MSTNSTLLLKKNNLKIINTKSIYPKLKKIIHTNIPKWLIKTYVITTTFLLYIKNYVKKKNENGHHIKKKEFVI